jgi:transposase-like protein
MTDVITTCPECHSGKLRKEGFASRWKDRQVTRLQRYRCLDCGLLTTKPNNDHDVNILDPEKYHLTCLRCRHEWDSNNPHPTRCAKCKSPYWDKPKHDVNTDAPVVATIHDVNKEEKHGS